MKHIACSGIGLVLLLSLTGVPAGAQNQAPAASQTPSSGSSSSGSSSSGSSLGDYARQVRKDPGTASSKPKVFDNDNLPREDKLSVVGRTPASASDNSAAQSETAAPAANDAKSEAKGTSEAKTESQVKPPSNTAAPAPDDEAAKAAASKQWADKLATQKDQIDLLGRELDVLQREYQIRAAAMYADAGNRMRNSTDWDKQDTQYKQQIADKQKALDEAKQKLEDTQEEARKAGVPASVREP
jgi:hypothetical protein